MPIEYSARSEIVSVKMRDMVNSYSEYDTFFRELEHRHRFTLTPVNGEFQGAGHSLSDGKDKIILVKHESGLEILYIAGSIASLISLVQLVVQGWRTFRSHRRQHARPEPHEIEIRQLDSAGKLIEERAHSLDAFQADREGVHLFPFATLLESELRRISAQVVKLTERVQALEAARKPGRKPATARRKKSKGNG